MMALVFDAFSAIAVAISCSVVRMLASAVFAVLSWGTTSVDMGTLEFTFTVTAETASGMQ